MLCWADSFLLHPKPSQKGLERHLSLYDVTLELLNFQILHLLSQFLWIHTVVGPNS